MKYIAIAGIVLLIIFGAWFLLRKDAGYIYRPPAPYVAGGGGGQTGQGIVPPSVALPHAEAIDSANEAGKKALPIMLEDLAVSSPGAIIRWRRNFRKEGALQDFDIGRMANEAEVKDGSKTIALPGLVIISTQEAYIPIEYTFGYSFIEYDRAKYLIMISGNRNEQGVESNQQLIVWDKSKKKMLKEIPDGVLKQPALGGNHSAIMRAMKATLAYAEFGRIPSGTYAGGTFLRPEFAWDNAAVYRGLHGDEAGFGADSQGRPMGALTAKEMAAISFEESSENLKGIQIAEFG